MKTYFFKESAALLTESCFASAVLSTLLIVESAVFSIAAFVESFVSSTALSAESLHAAKAPIARINNNFLIVPCLVYLKNDLLLIPVTGKGNPVLKKKF